LRKIEIKTHASSEEQYRPEGSFAAQSLCGTLPGPWKSMDLVGKQISKSSDFQDFAWMWLEKCILLVILT